MTRVVAIGECMAELTPAGPGLLRQGFAGDAYNTAVYLKRTRPEIEVGFLTVTGADPLSLQMRQAWRDDGIADDLAFFDPTRRPAIYLIETDAGGDRRFHYWRSESAARGWLQALKTQGGAERLQSADVIYVSGISLAILPPGQIDQAIALLRELGDETTIAYDPNLRPALWPSIGAARACLETMAGVAHVLLPSRQDLQELLGLDDARAQLDALIEFGAGEIVVTCEGDDCLVYDGEKVTAVTPPSATVVDTSGGGDSFNGAYLAARLTGSTPADAAVEGLALAARVVEQPGALIPA